MIDLSKAYAGQIATLANGRTILIDKIIKTLYRDIHQSAKCLAYLINPDVSGFMYFKDGSDTENQSEFNIISISDSIQVQVARLEGEIKGINFAILTTNNATDARVLFKRLNEVQTELNNLQNNQ
jgi:hypothetical protein